VVQRRERLRLTRKSLGERGVPDTLLCDEFQRDDPVQGFLPRLVSPEETPPPKSDRERKKLCQ